METLRKSATNAPACEWRQVGSGHRRRQQEANRKQNLLIERGQMESMEVVEWL
jgi:hypothetical protein